MNKFLRIFIGLSIILLVLSVTALSCNKAGGGSGSGSGSGSGGGDGSGSGGNNDGGNGGVRDGNGGNGGVRDPLAGCTTGTTGTNICFENFDASVAEKATDGTIQLKVSGFPKVAASTDIATTDIAVVKTTDAANFKRAFDLTIKVDGTAAAEGLLLVGPGNLLGNNVTNFSVDKGVDQALTTYTERKEGIVSVAATGAATANGLLPSGWNILTPFMKDGTPASANADASPFAFTATSGIHGTKPILFCRTTISTITSAASVQTTTKLTGGQKASCYVGALGADFTGKAVEDWLNETAGNNFKKKFNIAVAGIKTDTKTVDNIGLKAADKVAAFRDGIDKDELKLIAEINPSTYKKFAVEVVRGDFAYKPPEIIFENFDTSIAEPVGDDTNTIHLKVSGFPKVAASTDIATTDITAVKMVHAARFKRAFDVIIAKGTSGDAAATGGLVLVGPGNLLGNNVTNFSVDAGVNKDITTYSDDERKEGIRSDEARGAATANGLLPLGWNILSPFMKDGAPTSADADTSPFAFTARSGTDATKPIFFCKTTISTITSGLDAGAGTAQDDTKLTGGQKASCYVGASGVPFIGKAAEDWLNETAGNTFKKKFNIAVAGIRTDDNPISKIGLTAADKAAAFRNGLTQVEMKEIADKNPSAHKKVAIEVVRGDFAYKSPEIVIDNFAPGVRLNNNAIQIKTSAFPTTAATTDITADITIVANDALAGSLNKIFDVKITGGFAGDATGGLVMIGPGDITGTGDFRDLSIGVLGSGTQDQRKEGFISAVAGSRNQSPVLMPGWNYYGIFMNLDTPTSSTSGPDVSPFAFTESPTKNSHPFMFCRSTLTEVTHDMQNMPGSIKATTTFAGGQTAHCYIGAKGAAFTGGEVTDWLGATAGNSFKKTFNITIGAFRTDDKTVADIMPGVDDAAKVTALSDGLSKADIADIISRYPNKDKKVSVTIVDDSTW